MTNRWNAEGSLLLWDGTHESLQLFMSSLNNNNRGIEFKYEANQHTINFLDLNIRSEGDTLVTSTYFKATDRNSFIPRDSCHHRPWLDSVPKSQFIRMRRNCTRVDDFDTQTRMLRNRLCDKGYDLTTLNNKIEEVRMLDRDSLLVDRPRMAERDPGNLICPFSTRYSQQHFSVKKLIRKHWHMVKNDPVLGTVLPDKPCLIFRGAPPIKQLVAPTVCNPPIYKPMFFQNLIGFYRCNNCAVCSINAIKSRKTTEFTSRKTNHTFPIKSFVTCSTQCSVSPDLPMRASVCWAYASSFAGQA